MKLGCCSQTTRRDNVSQYTQRMNKKELVSCNLSCTSTTRDVSQRCTKQRPHITLLKIRFKARREVWNRPDFTCLASAGGVDHALGSSRCPFTVKVKTPNCSQANGLWLNSGSRSRKKAQAALITEAARSSLTLMWSSGCRSGTIIAAYKSYQWHDCCQVIRLERELLMVKPLLIRACSCSEGDEISEHQPWLSWMKQA